VISNSTSVPLRLIILIIPILSIHFFCVQTSCIPYKVSEFIFQHNILCYCILSIHKKQGWIFTKSTHTQRISVPLMQYAQSFSAILQQHLFSHTFFNIMFDQFYRLFYSKLTIIHTQIISS